MALGEEVAREPLLVSLLECVDEFCALLIEQGPSAVLRAFTNASSYILHRRVIYETDHGSHKGVTAGLDNNGFLKVRNDFGLVETLYTGGVRPDTGQPL
jgi:BirA family biotin operon repressor/biotin-[acetyl-CoA-carboxylase] ligase